MKFFALCRHDGGVEVMQIPGSHTVEECLAAWPANRQAEIASWRGIEKDEIPTSRAFRGAWNHELAVDMARARDIKRDMLRRERAPVLSSLDTDYMRADENNDVAEKENIAIRKQALRDITKHKALEDANTPEALERLTLLDLA